MNRASGLLIPEYDSDSATSLADRREPAVIETGTQKSSPITNTQNRRFIGVSSSTDLITGVTKVARERRATARPAARLRKARLTSCKGCGSCHYQILRDERVLRPTPCCRKSPAVPAGNTTHLRRWSQRDFTQGCERGANPANTFSRSARSAGAAQRADRVAPGCARNSCRDSVRLRLTARRAAPGLRQPIFSSAAGPSNLILRCVESQKGLFADWPQRHR